MFNRKNSSVCIFNLIVLLFFYKPVFALNADEIVVVANKNASESIGIARYYMEKRRIPKANLISVWITDKEWCTREAFESKVVVPVRRYLTENDPSGKIRCLVTVYGLPLRVEPPAMRPDQKTQANQLKEKQYALSKQMKNLPKEDREKRTELQKQIKQISETRLSITRHDHRSAFDSELSLVLFENYSLKGWKPNPYFLGFKNQKLDISKEDVRMVSRLDGPDAATVKRIIDESIAVEKIGLTGTAYFDARWPAPDPDNPKKNTGGYAAYDVSIHQAAAKVRGKNRMSVVLDNDHSLFQPGDCPNTALYCGWYSHQQYIDAFEWQPGAVGYHIASSECSTLKNEKSQVWCKKMIDNGVAATIGPVGEPYLQAFPVPEIFFGLLVDGYLSLVECYFLSLPYLSWQMVLVGDPLYTPFKKAGSQKDNFTR